ncbi:MAG: hypothetical protein NC102_10235 [Clostridium sp.]|nr:hypothetical protein [Clostridium sp.]
MVDKWDFEHSVGACGIFMHLAAKQHSIFSAGAWLVNIIIIRCLVAHIEAIEAIDIRAIEYHFKRKVAIVGRDSDLIGENAEERLIETDGLYLLQLYVLEFIIKIQWYAHAEVSIGVRDDIYVFVILGYNQFWFFAIF